MNELKALCAFAGMVMFFSLLAPFGYSCSSCGGSAAAAPAPAAAAEPQPLSLMTKKSVMAGGVDCKDSVWVEQLDWSEYQTLLNLAASSLKQIDGIGSADAKKQEDALAKAGLPGDPNAAKARDLFFMGPTGEQVMLYDVHAKKAVSPNEACPVTNIIVNGKMSFAALVDNTRFCVYDPRFQSCSKGLPDAAELTSLANKSGLLSELDNALKANDYNKIADLQKKNSDITKAFTDTSVRVPTNEDEAKALSAEEKDMVVKKYRDFVATETQKAVDGTNPYNVVMSDYMTVDVLRGIGSELYILPTDLIRYIDWLSGWKAADEIYMTAMGASMLIGTGAAIKSVKQGIKEAGGVGKYVKGAIAGGAKKVLAALSGGKNRLLEAMRQGASSIKSFARLDDIGTNLKNLAKAKQVKNVENELKELQALAKTGTRNTEYRQKLQAVTKTLKSYQDDLGAELSNLQKYEGTIRGEEVVGMGGANIIKMPDGHLYHWKSGAWTGITPNAPVRTPAQLSTGGGKYYASKLSDEAIDAYSTALKETDGAINSVENCINQAGAGVISGAGGASEHLAAGAGSAAKAGEAIADPVNGLIAALDKAGPLGNGKWYSRAFVKGSAYADMKTGYEQALKELTDAKPLATGAGLGGAKGATAYNLMYKTYAGVLAFMRLYGATKFGSLMFWGSKLMIFSMTTLWLYNDFLRQPYFAADLFTIYISKDKLLKATSDGLKNAYLETITDKGSLLDFVPKKKGSFPGLELFDLVMQNLGSPELPKSIMNKLNGLGSHVFIFDEANAAASLTAPPNTNVISKLGAGWEIFSRYRDNAGAIVYEDPVAQKDVTGDGKRDTAIWLQSRNLDISASYREKEDWNEKAFMAFRGTLSFFGRNMIAGGLVGGVPKMLRLTIGIGALGGVPAGIATGFLWVWAGGQYYKISQEQITDLFSGKVVDTNTAYNNMFDLCSTKLKEHTGLDGGPYLGDVGQTKMVVYTSFYAGMALHAAGDVFLPLHFFGYIADGINIWASIREQEVEEKAMRDMQTCMETNFKIVAQQAIPTKKDVEKDFATQLNDAFQQAIAALKAISPEAGNLAQNLTDQNFDILHLAVESNPGVLDMYGKALYDVHFQDANVRWVQDDKCQIEFCSQKGEGFACAATKGYFLLDENGNVLLETPLANMLSMHVDMENGYAGIAQKVVNIKKTSDSTPVMKISTDKVEVADTCLKETLRKELLGLQNIKDESFVNSRISESLGKLDLVQTDEAIIWPDANELVVRFTRSTSGCGKTLASIHHLPGASLEFNRDGSIVIKDERNQKLNGCKLTLGSSGVISFTNAMLRQGYAQAAIKKKDGTSTKAADYSNVYHLFIYDIVTAQATGPGSEFSTDKDAWSWEQCKPEGAPEGTVGFRLKAKIAGDNPSKQTQWDDALAGICLTNGSYWKGQEGTGRADFKGDSLYYTTPDNKTIVYNNLKYDPETGTFSATGPDGKPYTVSVERGPDGTPQIIIRDDKNNVVGGPIPLLWANGLGGSLMYNPDTGKISISNEFPFAINPNFQTYGGGGLGMITPGLPPWGGTPSHEAKGATTAVEKPPNVLAQLPWLPEGYELFVFIVMLGAALTLVRIRVSIATRGRRKCARR